MRVGGKRRDRDGYFSLRLEIVYASFAVHALIVKKNPVFFFLSYLVCSKLSFRIKSFFWMTSSDNLLWGF